MDLTSQLLITECKRRIIGEGVPRIKKCLSELSVEEVWLKPNSNSNSVGNLVLHLCGNVRQWLISGLGGLPDTRKRSLEFNEKGPISKDELVSKLDSLVKDVEETLDSLNPKFATQKIVVQGFEETGLSIMVHVIEHFSYHVGQITYFVKLRKDIDTGYYAGVELEK